LCGLYPGFVAGRLSDAHVEGSDHRCRAACEIGAKNICATEQSIINNKREYGWCPRRAHAADLEHRYTGGLPKEAIMKHSARVMSLLMALSGAVVPAALAQTPPAQTPPAQTQTQKPPHPKASGAAKGAAIGAVGGNAAKGAVIGAGHSRREERRTERKKK
jgi:hypothetical protein